MRESVPSLCVEIYQFPHPKAVDDFCFLFAYAGFYVPGTRKSDTCRRSVQGMSREHPGARRNYAGAADCCIAARCPLCGEHRRSLPSEVFLGRISPDDPKAGTHGRRAGGVMTPQFKGKTEIRPLSAQSALRT